jgi:O-antigen/teichoic acid export membrane protein
MIRCWNAIYRNAQVAELSEGRRFSRESFIYMIGEFFSKSLSFILIPLFASYLSKADFAVNNLVAIVWPVLVIVKGSGFSGRYSCSQWA